MPIYSAPFWDLERTAWVSPAAAGARATADLRRYIDGGVTYRGTLGDRIALGGFDEVADATSF